MDDSGNIHFANYIDDLLVKLSQDLSAAHSVEMPEPFDVGGAKKRGLNRTEISMLWFKNDTRLNPGSQGENIESVQAYLGRMGYDVGAEPVAGMGGNTFDRDWGEKSSESFRMFVEDSMEIMTGITIGDGSARRACGYF